MLRASALKSSDLSLPPRHGLKLMRLIERVLLHRAAQLGEAPYRRRRLMLDHPKVRYAKAASTDPLPEFLSVSEAKHLITFLSDTRPRPWLSHTRRNSHVVWANAHSAKSARC